MRRLTRLGDRLRALGTLPPGTLVVLLAAVGIALGFLCPLTPEPTPLPPKLATAVERHVVQTAVDTLRTAQLRASAARDAARADSAERVATLMIRKAAAARAEATRLAEAARLAATAQDSAARWQAAYEARTVEADTLRAALVLEQQATTAARARGDSLHAALLITEVRAARADSLIKATIAVATRPSCRVLGLVRCPSRAQVAVAGAVVGALVTVRLTR